MRYGGRESASAVCRISYSEGYYRLSRMVARQGYSHGRGIESSKKGKIRIGVHHLLLAVLALTLLILFFSARLIQINSSGVSASGGELSPKVQTYNVIENKDSNNVVTSNINNGASDDGKNSFHFIVSSDCTSYQRWEILTQLHSAQSIQQCGRFTWIVSGWYVFLSIMNMSCIPLYFMNTHSTSHVTFTHTSVSRRVMVILEKERGVLNLIY